MGLHYVRHAELCAVWKRISIKHPQISFQNSRIRSESSDQPVHMKLFFLSWSGFYSDYLGPWQCACWPMLTFFQVINRSAVSKDNWSKSQSSLKPVKHRPQEIMLEPWTCRKGRRLVVILIYIQCHPNLHLIIIMPHFLWTLLRPRNIKYSSGALSPT